MAHHVLPRLAVGHDMRPQVGHHVLAPSWVVVVRGAGCNRSQCSAEGRADRGGGVVQIGVAGLLWRFQALCAALTCSLCMKRAA